MKKVIEFDNVSKEYELYQKVSYKEVLFNLFSEDKKKFKDRFVALKDISFSIYEGESVGIIGENGSGKSTTLGLIAGVIKANSGNVVVNELVSPLLELGGGFHPELNAYENIKLNGVLLGISLKDIEKKSDDIIKFAELGEFADQPIHMYSSGMLARLGFSIVTQIKPKLLLIDEVLAVGDEYFRNKCIDLMKRFKKEHVTIVLVSHNAQDIRELCDRVIWIDRHKIRMDSNTDEVLNAYHSFMQNRSIDV